MARARLYCLSNPYMPGLVKIGFTRRSVSQRMTELSFGTRGTSATGVPGAFVLVKDWAIDHDTAHEIEQRVHHALRAHRVKSHGGRRAREFFHLEPEAAVQQVQQVLQVLAPLTSPPGAPAPPSPARQVSAPSAAAAPRAVFPDPYSGWPPRPGAKPKPKPNPTFGPWLLVAVALLVWFIVKPH